MRRFGTVPSLIIFTTLLSSCQQAPPPPGISESQVHGQFVLLASGTDGEPVAFARVILGAGLSCPEITGDTSIPMSKRENPHGFSVDVCEAAVPFDTNLAISLGEQTLSLPTARRNPTGILAMGDTGCKQKDCQTGTPAEPFASLASAAAQKEWDFILHMGDYNYRGTPSKVVINSGSSDKSEEYGYDVGDGTTENEYCLQAPDSGFISQNAPGNSPRDSWETWRDDFFLPAGELLPSAPWIFARGNHELCSRAGPGWFYFLDAGSNLPESGGKQRSCPTPDPSKNPIENVVLVEPYAVNLESLNVIVLDSANACDGFAPAQAQDFLDAYASQFSTVEGLAAGEGTSWFMTHRPIWGVQNFEKDKSTACTPANQYSCVNQTLQYGITHSSGGKLPKGLELSLAGHMHHFQSLTFAEGAHPPQVIIGDGGVELGDWGPVGKFATKIDGVAVEGRAIATEVEAGAQKVPAFGFLEITYSPDGTWKGSLANVQRGVELAGCGSQKAAAGSVCEFTAEPVPNPQ